MRSLVSHTLPHTLTHRAHILRTLRGTLDGMGFVEVETPVRIAAPANEPYIEVPPAPPLFLRASPELDMKRLLASGMDRIYQIGPCFREGEKGQRHNPEFTMLEWYRANAGYDDILDDVATLVRDVAVSLHGRTAFPFGGTTIEVGAPWEILTVQEAYRRFAGWDPLEAFDTDRFDLDMALKIEPSLPRDRPCVLKDYPAPAAALARLSPQDPRIAERWELYIGGIEICNAFGELTDAAEQRRRFEEAAQKRRAMGSQAYPLDEAFLASLASLPPSGGAALGVDRLCMVALD